MELTGGLANFVLPKMPLTKFAQTVQKILFGVGLPTGAYPFMIFMEANQCSRDNQLTNNWPGLTSWAVPIPPSPIFLFNFEGSLTQAFIPNMALKFRTLDYFVFKLPKDEKPSRYYYREKKTGIIHYYNADEVVDARNPRYPDQKKVKVGNRWKWVGLEEEGEKAAQANELTMGKETQQALQKGEKTLGAEANKEEKGVFQEFKDKIPFFEMFKQIPIDVTDRDDPPDHTFLVYSSFPGTSTGLLGTTNSLQCVSETSVEGSGLDATKINDPPYSAKLKPADTSTIAKFLNVQTMVTNLAKTNQLPSINDMFSLSGMGSSK